MTLFFRTGELVPADELLPAGEGVPRLGQGDFAPPPGGPKLRTIFPTHGPVKHHRAIFISDTHLGTRGCQAHLLLDFLRHNDADVIYLIGDIIDGWQLKRSWYWDDVQDEVVHLLLHRAQSGRKVVYVPGNHDEAVRAFAGLHAGGVEIEYETIHEGPDGKRYWVLHGDQFDAIVRHWKWLALIGDHAYVTAIRLNILFGKLRKAMGLPYWSLSAWLKYKVKNAVAFISHYEEAVVDAARSKGVDGVICGHIHHAEIRQFDDVLYINDGDWVESCTAVCEDAAGQFEIVRWTRLASEQQAEEQQEAGAQSVDAGEVAA